MAGRVGAMPPGTVTAAAPRKRGQADGDGNRQDDSRFHFRVLASVAVIPAGFMVAMAAVLIRAA